MDDNILKKEYDTLELVVSKISSTTFNVGGEIGKFVGAHSLIYGNLTSGLILLAGGFAFDALNKLNIEAFYKNIPLDSYSKTKGEIYSFTYNVLKSYLPTSKK